MEILLPVLRAVHIVSGVYWAGAMFFFVELLEPSLRATGPAGGRVMRELVRRGLLRSIPGAAVFTVVAGAWLYWIISGHLSSAWGHSPFGTSITIGAVAGIVAMVIGLGRIRPLGLRAYGLIDQALEAESEEERSRLMAELEPIRTSLRNWARAAAALLMVAVLTMAVARYI